jgi:metal-responsive CopG/Arc/MetJ family transcriptional regulator
MRKDMRMTTHTATQGGLGSAPGATRVPVNLSLPRELVAELDHISGPRNRSAFAEEAIRRAIRREQLRLSIEGTAGTLNAEDYPHWRTSTDVVAWVREMRAEVTSIRDDPA